MGRWQHIVSTVGAARFISALGGLYVGLAVLQASRTVVRGGPLGGILVDFVLFAAPGVVLLYGGYRLPRADLLPDVHPRVATWCLGGFGLMLVVVGLLLLNPEGSVDRPLRAAVIATALGSIGGLGIGSNEARALTRAAEAEQRNRELTRYETLIEEATDVNVILKPDGTFQYLTPSVEHVLGYAPDELIGEDASTYLHPDDRQDVIETFTEATEPGARSQTVEFRFKHQDGSWVVLEGRSRNLLDDPVIEGIVAYTYDITERKQLEDDLRYERDLRERIVETSPIGIVVVDADGSISSVNQYAAEILGFPEDELTELEYDEPTVEATGPDGTPVEEEIFQQVLSTGEPIHNAERQITRADGQRIWLSVNGAPLHDPSGDTTGVVFALEDVTERKQYRDRLISLNELSQDLTDAETKQAVSDLVVETGREMLPLPLIAIALYDEEYGRLRYTAQTSAVTDLIGNDSLFESERSLSWQVFSDQTQTVYDDLLEQADLSESDTPLRSAMIYPLGEYGVLIGGATTTNVFSDIDISLAQMLVANARSALDRVDREQKVREQRDTLAERNTTLERVQRINSTIRGITTELIQASTREEIVQAVCDRLADAEAYQLAWVGTHDAVTDDVDPEAWTGVEDGFLETVTETADESEAGHGPTGRAVRTREPQVRNNLAGDPPFEPWQQAALDRGYRAGVAVPIVYQDTLYGVLSLYADQPDVFNRMEEAVLTELGETIGFALNALERRQALVSEQSVELQFQLRNGDPPLFQLASEHDCEFEFENIVQRADGPPGIFVTIRGVPPDEVLAFGEKSPKVEELTLISDRDGEALFEARLRDSAFFSALLDRGAMPQTLTATGDEGYAVIRVPRTSNIRSFAELFEAQYEDVELVGRREVDEPIKTQQEFEAEFRTQLTERQEEILKAAYVSGFFDWPREMTAQELAEMQGVTQPTVSRHIRAGERKLFGLVFDEE